MEEEADRWRNGPCHDWRTTDPGEDFADSRNEGSIVLLALLWRTAPRRGVPPGPLMTFQGAPRAVAAKAWSVADGGHPVHRPRAMHEDDFGTGMLEGRAEPTVACTDQGLSVLLDLRGVKLSSSNGRARNRSVAKRGPAGAGLPFLANYLASLGRRQWWIDAAEWYLFYVPGLCGAPVWLCFWCSVVFAVSRTFTNHGL